MLKVNFKKKHYEQCSRMYTVVYCLLQTMCLIRTKAVCMIRLNDNRHLPLLTIRSESVNSLAKLQKQNSHLRSAL